MTDQLDEIRDFFTCNGIFACRPSGKSEGAFEVEIQHLLGKPATSEQLSRLERAIGKSLTPTHRELLALWNGCTFFAQLRPVLQEVGIRLYSTEEIPQFHTQIITQNKSALEELLDNPDPDVVQGAGDDLANWLPNLLTIGEELKSGNYFVLDYRQISDSGDSPVVYLDHELMGMGSYDRKVIADSVLDLLVKMTRSPAQFLTRTLSCITRYRGERAGEQWIPAEYHSV